VYALGLAIMVKMIIWEFFAIAGEILGIVLVAAIAQSIMM
jgi:hypothetical protein